MKRRGMAMALLVLLCAAALFSGTLLILHAGHECQQASCPVCAVLTQHPESFLCLLIAFKGIGLRGGGDGRCLFALSENRFVPDWTPVRRKVKLQN